MHLKDVGDSRPQFYAGIGLGRSCHHIMGFLKNFERTGHERDEAKPWMRERIPRGSSILLCSRSRISEGQAPMQGFGSSWKGPSDASGVVEALWGRSVRIGSLLVVHSRYTCTFMRITNGAVIDGFVTLRTHVSAAHLLHLEQDIEHNELRRLCSGSI